MSDEEDDGDTVGSVLRGFLALRKRDPVTRCLVFGIVCLLFWTVFLVFAIVQTVTRTECNQNEKI